MSSNNRLSFNYEKDYVLSSAFDSATSVNALVIYLFGLGALMEGKNWWFNPSDDAEHCLPGS